jgi:hypothetical protein
VDTETHDRIHHDIVDKSASITLRVAGEPLRDLTIDPCKDLPAPNPQMKNTRTYVSVGPGVRDVLRHHTVGLTGFEPATP